MFSGIQNTPEETIKRLERELRAAQIKVREGDLKIAQLSSCLDVAHKLVALAIANNHTDPEMEGELNMIKFWLERETDQFSDEQIPF